MWQIPRRKKMKTFFNILAAIGIAIAIWSCGENDGTVFSDSQTLLIGIAGLAMFGIGAFLAKVCEESRKKR